MQYQTDWKYVWSAVGAAGVAGGVLGLVVGISRFKSGLRHALVASTQGAVFAGSYFLVREGVRHVVRVSEWSDSWYEINSVSCALSSAALASVRGGWNRMVFSGGLASGFVVGLAASVVFVELSRVVKNSNVTNVTEDQSKDANVDTNKESFWRIPTWVPFRPLTNDELEKRTKMN